MKTVFVTGAVGFIGFNLINQIFSKRSVDMVVMIDNAPPAQWAAMRREINPKYCDNLYTIEGDVGQRELMADLFNRYKPQTVYHLAAESHVDRSIANPKIFLESNVCATFRFLQAASRYYQLEQGKNPGKKFRFIYVGTDEVYGSMPTKDCEADEGFILNPSSPYAASKVAAEAFCQSFYHTYDLPVIITRCCKNYGPWQMPEKLIPLMIVKALAGRQLPIYGNGQQVREWLHVEDHCEALLSLNSKGKPGTIYNIGSGVRISNAKLVAKVCELVKHRTPKDPEVVNVPDRPGHDKRYAIDCSRISSIWQPKVQFDRGIEQTVDWYLDHLDWVHTIESLGKHSVRQMKG